MQYKIRRKNNDEEEEENIELEKVEEKEASSRTENITEPLRETFASSNYNEESILRTVYNLAGRYKHISVNQLIIKSTSPQGQVIFNFSSGPSILRASAPVSTAFCPEAQRIEEEFLLLASKYVNETGNNLSILCLSVEGFTKFYYNPVSTFVPKDTSVVRVVLKDTPVASKAPLDTLKASVVLKANLKGSITASSSRLDNQDTSLIELPTGFVQERTSGRSINSASELNNSIFQHPKKGKPRGRPFTSSRSLAINALHTKILRICEKQLKVGKLLHISHSKIDKIGWPSNIKEYPQYLSIDECEINTKMLDEGKIHFARKSSK